MKKVYAYHPVTGAFIGTTEADESPLEPGVYHLPAQTTDQKPPRARKGHFPAFDVKSGKWVNRRVATPDDPETPVPIDLAQQARARRNALLAESDWTQLFDAPLNDKQLSDWRRYRRELRQITEQSNFPETIIWPQKP